MAKYKDYSYEQTVLLPVSFSNQILPGTFEYALNFVIDDLDLSIFEEQFTNDETGAPAYDHSILLKIILFAYSKGIISSRKIERLCGVSPVGVGNMITLDIIKDGLNKLSNNEQKIILEMLK
ncbi:MAG: transposase [Bacteroidales bacterium]|nr:transposase [Bacteroidales bacterium]